LYIERKECFENEYLQELTLQRASELMAEEMISSEQLTEVCMKQIENLDRQGPCLNAVIEVNPAALDEARNYDKLRAEGIICGPLHGIPILIKDNIATGITMHTSAGTMVLAECYAKNDAPLVKKLKDAGAVIIAKTNMTEWAHFTSSDMPSGYSARGGQTRNFYDSDYEVGGSSSGSAVGVTAGYGLAAIGTETSGSIIKPSVNSGLMGFKPSPGIINGEGIIPIAKSQDVPGPICKTAEDLRIMMSVLADGSALKNIYSEGSEPVRLGVLREFFVHVCPLHTELIEHALEKLKNAGMILVDIDTFAPYDALYGECQADRLEEEVLFCEFAEDLETYLREWALEPPVHTLEEIIEFNHKDPERNIKYGQDVLEDALKAKKAGGRSLDIYREARARDLRICADTGLEKVMEENNLDAVVFPHYFGATIAARAGYPSVTIPAGADKKKGFTAIVLTGRRENDSRLLALAEKTEKILDLQHGD